jgi:hypothetical protein
MNKRTFTVAELEALGLPWMDGGPDTVVVHIEHHADETKWFDVHHVTFRYEDRLWQVPYYEGRTAGAGSGWATDPHPTEVVAVEVEAVEVTTVRYQPVKESR